MVKYIKDLNGSSIYGDGGKLYGDGQIILSYIIFDKDGNSIAEEKTLLSNFTGTTTITKSLQQGEYTITACVYMKDDETNWWTQEKPGSLKDYRIVYNDSWIGLSGVLGFYKQTLALDKSETLSINVPSAVGFVILNFTNLNLSGIQTIRYGIKTWNQHLNVEAGTSSLLELLNDGNIFSKAKNSAYSNLTTTWHYLPTPQFSVVWEGRNASGTVVKSGTIPSSERPRLLPLTPIPGKQLRNSGHTVRASRCP
ncbi:hypothetical protein FACS189435_2750 [Bacteroidia bacterium]|nr:hypothetical protein FACS189435_2750 [Bacteroidia bacterium]